MVHGPRRLPHRVGRVGEVLLVREARAVFSHEGIPGAASLVGGDVLREYVEHALDLGERGGTIRPESEERGAHTDRVGTVERLRRGRWQNGVEKQDAGGEGNREESHRKRKREDSREKQESEEARILWEEEQQAAWWDLKAEGEERLH